ncbi:MAG TPA: VWA domain-containing protein [Kiritimatiellia bacterium]|nr:VWA domain-containing protein [Kiritimatiellia bacterium]
MSTLGLHVPLGREARLPWIRGALFAAALALSLALHALLLAEFPALPMGRPAAWNARSPVRPLVVREVRALPDLPLYAGPEKFRPENPEAFADVEPLQKSLLDDLRAGAEALDFVPPAPAEAAAPAPAPAAELAGLDFRQDILAVEKKVAADELAALPRRLAPAVARVPGAPDVTLPATADAIAAAAAAVDGRGDASLQALSVLSRAAPPAGAMIDAANQGALSAADRLREQGALLDEKTADVTDVQPIEQLLAVEVSTYAATDENALYFELAISRAGTEALPVLPKDVLLIQDCSESITRSKLDYFKAGIEAYLRTLTTVDRVNLMRYSDSPTLCFPEWQPATAESLGQAARFADDMRARGQTDLFTPLQQVLKLPRTAGRPTIAVLMTDGRPTMGTVDSSDIIARFSQQNAGEISVFTVGAGDRVNTFLLDLLGHNNRGGSWIMPLREQIPDAVKRAARELSRPVLANLAYRFSGDSAAEVYPATLTHLYLDRPLRLYGRCPLDQKAAVLQIVGESGAQKRDMVFALDLAEATDGGEGLRREWVAQKIYRLINDHLAGGRAETVQEIRDLSIRHNVPLPYGADFPL